MRLSDVINRFALISRLEPEAVSKWTVLCVDAVQYLRQRLRSDAELTEENMMRLANAAASLAYYKYTLYEPSAAVRSFTAASLAVNMGEDEKQRAKALWKEEQQLLSDLLKTDDDFCFKGVRI